MVYGRGGSAFLLWWCPSSYLVLPVWRGSVPCQAVSSPEVDESKEIIDQFDSGVSKWFYFLGASASVLPVHLDAAPTVTCPHMPVLPQGLQSCWWHLWMSACFYCVFWLFLLVTLLFHILLLCGFVFSILMLLFVSIFHSVSFLHSWKIFYIPDCHDRIPQMGWNELAFFEEIGHTLS